MPEVAPPSKQEPTEPWILQGVPKSALSWHLVSQSDSSFDLDRLENAAVVRPWTFDGVSPDVLILKDGKAELVTGLFRGVEISGGRTARPLEGAWPEPLTLTVATTGRNREGQVLWRQQDRFSPLPGELASYLWFFLLPPRNGARQFLTRGDNGGYSLFEFPAGKLTDVRVESSVDDREFRVEHAAVQGNRLLVAGIIVEHDAPEARSGGGGQPGGSIVVQRFEGAASKPMIDRMPTAVATARAMSGMVTAGNFVFLALHGTSKGNQFAWYDGESWHSERMPVDPVCNTGTRILTGANDGSVFFAPYCFTEGVDAYRRDPNGNYSTITFPPDVDSCDLYAESADKVWLACSLRDGDGGRLFFSRPAQGPRTIHGATAKD